MGNGFGQGVLISDTEVLTAYHVVQGSGSIRAIIPAAAGEPEEARIASLRGFSSGLDIALLIIAPFSRGEIDFAGLPPTNTGNCAGGLDAVSNGSLVVLETTGDDDSNVDVFRVWGRRSIGVGGSNFETDIPGTAGLSGSPLYGEGGRTVVGIVVQKNTALSNIEPLIAVDGCAVASRLPDLRGGAKE
ncbi:MAG: serine protease [Dehalococcoidia bacterium]